MVIALKFCVMMILQAFNLTLNFHFLKSRFADILKRCRQRSDAQCQSLFSIMGALRHDSACLHFHTDQQPFLGGGAHWWDNTICRDKGGCQDDGGFWGLRLLRQVNVCMQVRTRIDWFVFRNLSERKNMDQS